MSRRVVARIVVLILSVGGYAVAGDPPGPQLTQVVAASSITLRWYPDDLREDAVQRVAAEHCAVSGRSSTLASVELDRSVEIGRYNCR